MNDLMNLAQTFWEDNPVVFFLFFFLGFISIIGVWKLFVKCNKPGIAALIPIYNMIVVLKIVGRPAAHIFLLLIPIYNVYFSVKIAVELCQSFGKYSVLDYILIIVLNMFYVLNLGLAYNEVYYGPVYGKKLDELKVRKPQFA